jgi:hypothetical protein
MIDNRNGLCCRRCCRCRADFVNVLCVFFFPLPLPPILLFLLSRVLTITLSISFFYIFKLGNVAEVPRVSIQGKRAGPPLLGQEPTDRK